MYYNLTIGGSFFLPQANVTSIPILTRIHVDHHSTTSVVEDQVHLHDDDCFRTTESYSRYYDDIHSETMLDKAVS